MGIKVRIIDASEQSMELEIKLCGGATETEGIDAAVSSNRGPTNRSVS